MRSETVPIVVRHRDIPEEIRSLAGMAGPDYIDLFTVAASAAKERSPEEWARAVIEGVPRAGQVIVWQTLLGLRLDPRPGPDRAAGWELAKRGDTWIRAEARSWFMTAHCLFHVEEAVVSFATFVRYDRPFAALLWPPVSVVHRRVVPDLLRAAVRRIG